MIDFSLSGVVGDPWLLDTLEQHRNETCLQHSMALRRDSRAHLKRSILESNDIKTKQLKSNTAVPAR